jgi:hypothetical protein
MGYWLVVKTDSMQEAKVARLLQSEGIATAVPQKISSHAASRHTKRRVITESPLYARHVFAMVNYEAELPQVRFTRGIARNASGIAWAISASQMSVWLESHSRWLETERKRHSRGEKVGKQQKTVKLTSFEELKAHFDAMVGAGETVDMETGEILERAA